MLINYLCSYYRNYASSIQALTHQEANSLKLVVGGTRRIHNIGHINLIPF